MKKIVEIALGIVTSVGGFLEIGSIATAAQAGAEFSFQLIWAIVLGGICIIFLVEQAGRFSAVSGRTIPDAAGDLEGNVWNYRKRRFDVGPGDAVFRRWCDHHTSALVSGRTRHVAVVATA